MEIWEPVKTHSIYSVSSLGNIKRNDTNRPMTKVLNHNGYHVIKFNIPNVKIYRVSRLVALTFIPNPNKLSQVNHIDGNKLNNAIDNLEWCDAYYNMKHAHDNNLVIRKKGELATSVKLSTLEVIDIFKSKLTHPKKDIAKLYNVSVANVNLIQNCKSRFEEIKNNLSETEINIILKSDAVISRPVKAVYELDSYNGRIIKEWKSVIEISESLKLNKGSISEVASGHKGSVHGHYFIYKEKFTQEAALNRDLDAERKILENG